MTRAQFVKAYADVKRVKRLKEEPDIRRSIEAVSYLDDQKDGEKLWRLHAPYLRPLSIAAFKQLHPDGDLNVTANGGGTAIDFEVPEGPVQ